MVRNEREKPTRTQFKECDRDISGCKMWNMVKCKAGQIRTVTPMKLLSNGVIISSLKKYSGNIEELLYQKSGKYQQKSKLGWRNSI